MKSSTSATMAATAIVPAAVRPIRVKQSGTSANGLTNGSSHGGVALPLSSSVPILHNTVLPSVAIAIPDNLTKTSPDAVIARLTPAAVKTTMITSKTSITRYPFPLFEVRPFRASSHRRHPIYDSEAQLTYLIKNCQKADIYISLLVENVNTFCQDCE